MLEHRYRRYGKDEDFWQLWISAWTMLGNLDAADFGCDEIVRSAKMFGWDGVRYDGHFSVGATRPWRPGWCGIAPRGSSRSLPGFGCGYNYCGPQHGTAARGLSDIEMAACARGGGLIMSEYYRNLLGPVRPTSNTCGGPATRCGCTAAIFWSSTT